MVFRHESPHARVGRIMTIVAHHPIIVHFEYIFSGSFAIKICYAIAIFERIAFVIYNTWSIA